YLETPRRNPPTVMLDDVADRNVPARMQCDGVRCGRTSSAFPVHGDHLATPGGVACTKWWRKADSGARRCNSKCSIVETIWGATAGKPGQQASRLGYWWWTSVARTSSCWPPDKRFLSRSHPARP